MQYVVTCVWIPGIERERRGSSESPGTSDCVFVGALGLRERETCKRDDQWKDGRPKSLPLNSHARLVPRADRATGLRHAGGADPVYDIPIRFLTAVLA